MGRRRFEKRDCFDDIDMPGGIVRVNSDDIAPAAPVARIVRDMSDGIDYALRQSLYQIPCRTATRWRFGKFPSAETIRRSEISSTSGLVADRGFWSPIVMYCGQCSPIYPTGDVRFLIESRNLAVSRMIIEKICNLAHTCGQIAKIPSFYMKSGSEHTIVRSEFRPEVVI